jgi:flagellar protein FliL
MAAQETNGKQKAEPLIETKPVAETKGRSLKLWVVLGIAIIAGVLAYFFTPYFRNTAVVSAKNAPAVKEQEISKNRHELVKATLVLDPFLVNLADKEEIRFVKTTFHLGLAKEPDEEAKNPVNIAAIRDSIISVLSAKTSEQILTPEGKDKLREEVRTRVASVAPAMKVLEVYIVDFVVQL